MEKVKNTPTLRFPEFKGEWEMKKLGEVTEKIGDGLHGTPLYSDDSDIYFINGNNLTNGKIEINENTKKVDYSVFAKNNKGLNKNTLLISINGTIGNIAKYNNEKVMLGKSVGYFNFKESTDFYYHILHTETIQNIFISELTGSTIQNLSLKTLRGTEITFPTLPEQQKIATFLTAVDEKLQALKQKKKLLEQYKKGVMQQIFSQEIRFKDDKGNTFADWEEKKLVDVCKTTKSGGTPKSTKREYYNGDIPFLSISDMTSQGKYLNYTTNHISKLGLDNSASWVVPSHSIIYSMYASVGFVAINNIPLATSQAVLNLILKDGINTDFIYYTLVDFQKKIAQFVTTGTQGNLNAQSVKGFEIQIPCVAEQTKIGNFLSAIDDKINHCQAQITNTEIWKKGLLQNMFV